MLKLAIVTSFRVVWRDDALGLTVRRWFLHNTSRLMSSRRPCTKKCILSFSETPNYSAGIHDMQRHDPDLADIINYLESDQLPDNDDSARSLLHTIDNYYLDNHGNLCHLWTPTGRRRTTPRSERA